MKKLLLFILLAGSSAFGQAAFSSLNLGTAGATCLTTAPFNCSVMQLPTQVQTLGVTLSGTFVATAQFEVSGDQGNTYVAAAAVPIPTGGAGISATTTTGMWIVSGAGITHFRIRLSAYTSGTVTVAINGDSGLASALSPLYFFSGTGWDPEFYCPNIAFQNFAASGSGNTQLVPLVAGQKIRVCEVVVSLAAGTDFKLTQGTGANCGTGTADLTGTMKAIVSFIKDASYAPYVTGTAQALCTNLGAAATGMVQVSYAQY